MHVPVGHSFPDATAVAFGLGLGPPSLLAAISRDRAPMVRGPYCICVVYYYYSFPNLIAFLSA